MVVKQVKLGLQLIAATLVVAALPSWAQVKVIDSSPVAPVTATEPAVSPVANAGAEFFSRMQLLEQEVLELRGLVEQQAFEIKRLKQQRLDDYTDLDQRISALIKASSSNVPVNSDSASSTIDNSTPSTVNANTKPLNERELYSEALNLLLQKKDFDGSLEKLTLYLDTFPQGLYAPNAHYWLGEINLSKQDLETSKQWFSELIEKFPGHSKVSDAKFKLGKVYFQLGETAKAKSLLTDVANSGSTAAQLAKDFIAVNGL